jgi:hypothetical protein
MMGSRRRIWIAAAVLLVPAFGAGVVIGGGTGKRPMDVGAVEMGVDPRLQGEVLACQQKLATPPGARARSAGAAGEADGGAPETAADVEALEKELKACRKSEVLVSAEVCSAAVRQFNALMALPNDGKLCGPKSRAADLIEENFERCAALAGIPADWNADSFTKEESRQIAEAIRVRETITEGELLRRLKEFVSTCTDTSGMSAPVQGSQRL